jgi:hypothetical protein
MKVGSFAEWATRSRIKIVTGDFNGNGRTDIALVRQEGGWSTVPIAFSNGDGSFRITNGKVGEFANWAATRGVRLVIGTFDNDGRTDIALVRQESGWASVPVVFFRW